jgi:hypothetical protein
MAGEKIYSLGARAEKTELERKRDAEIAKRDAEIAEQDAAAQAEMAARQTAIDHEEHERQLADKYDLAEMYRKDPALFPIEIALWFVMIEMLRPSTKYGGLIEKTASQLQAEEYLARIGKVIACGPSALEGKTESGVELRHLSRSVKTPEDLIGKYVIQQPHTGIDVWFAPLPGKKLKIISSTEILAVTTNPTMFMKP